jgi:hypothetical protein
LENELREKKKKKKLTFKVMVLHGEKVVMSQKEGKIERKGDIIPPRIEKFIIYNPLLQRKEKDTEKILYFFPSTESIDEQLNLCGFFETLVNFSTFAFSLFYLVYELSFFLLK